jgi:hypothetical protein
MTTYAQQAAPGAWLALDDLAHASGLRADLAARFIPATPTATGPLYSAHHIALARLVKELTEAATHEATIDAVVRDLRDRPCIDINWNAAKKTGPSRRIWAFIGAAAAAALVAGGIIGGLIGASNRNAAMPEAPVTVTAEAPTPTATIPAKPDPVCTEWAPINDNYRQKRSDWVKTDPNIPADRWSPEQRALSIGVIPALKAEAHDLARLSDQSSNPVLRSMLQMQSEYELVFADRLPHYSVEDNKLWLAATDFGNAVNSLCSATVSR